MTRKLKGFGVVTFLMPEHAVKAYSELDGSILHGRMLHLLPGKSKDLPEELNNPGINFSKYSIFLRSGKFQVSNQITIKKQNESKELI